MYMYSTCHFVWREELLAMRLRYPLVHVHGHVHVPVVTKHSMCSCQLPYTVLTSLLLSSL